MSSIQLCIKVVIAIFEMRGFEDGMRLLNWKSVNKCIE